MQGNHSAGADLPSGSKRRAAGGPNRPVWLGTLGLLAVLSLVMLLVGLFGRGKPTLGEVEGIVTLNGEPLADVDVWFMPDPQKGSQGRPARGRTDSNGRFRLQFDDSPVDGAVVGSHKVVLRDLRPENNRPGSRKSGQRGATQSRLPGAYEVAGTTPLSAEVKPGPQTINFPLTLPKQ